MKIEPSTPNSAGGVDVAVEFRNQNAATIKYLYVSVEPYNAVGDPVSSEIGGKTTAQLRVTGPVAMGSLVSKNAPTVWYNFNIDHLKLISIQIEYTDAVTVVIDGTNLLMDSDGRVTNKEHESINTYTPTKAELEAGFLGQLRSEPAKSAVPKMMNVPDKSLLVAGWRMCNHPDYDGVTLGDPYFVKLPKGIPKGARTWIWLAVTMSLCPK